MIKKYLFVILLLLPSIALADWTLVLKNQSGSSFYLDYSSIQSIGNNKKFWIMLDLEKPFKDVILSFKRQMEFDCASQTVRGLYIIGFSENLTKGRVLMDGSISSDFTPISPSSSESDFYGLVCSKN